MGFLLGAFGKLSALRRKQDIQSKLMRIQSRLKRATKQAADMDTRLQRQEKIEMNNANALAMQAKQSALAQLQERTGLAGFSGLTDLTDEQRDAYQKAMNDFNTGSTNISASYEQYKAFYQNQVSEKYEYLRETQYEPLKQEEELLQTEKAQLESQLQLAENDYKACQDMEKDGAKNLAPQYTAGGN